MPRFLLLSLLFLQSINIIAQDNNSHELENKDLKESITLSESTKQELANQIKTIASKNKDSLKIFSVSPSTDLIHGDIYTFSVIVIYNLVSKDKGLLKIGFNNGLDEWGYRMISGADKIIDKQSGYHIFEVKTRVINWKDSGNDFYTLTNLSEYPHPTKWSPLCSDRVSLKVK